MTFSISTKIQDGGQNSGNSTFFRGTFLVPTVFKICSWRENDFWEKSPVDEYVFFFFSFLHGKSRSRTIPEINAFLHFTQKFKRATKNGGKAIFPEKSPVHSADILRVKNFIKIALSCTISNINAFLRFMQKFKMVAKNGRKAIFGKSHQ